MKSLGSRPPISILSEMIDKADSDRNGKVQSIMFVSNTFIKSDVNDDECLYVTIRKMLEIDLD